MVVNAVYASVVTFFMSRFASQRTVMRQEMRRRLGVAGVRGREGREATKRLRTALVARGAEDLGRRVAARYGVAHTPAASLRSWRSKKGLAGVQVAAEVKEEVLAGLEDWARERYGDLEAGVETEERYVLDVFRLRAS